MYSDLIHLDSIWINRISFIQMLTKNRVDLVYEFMQMTKKNNLHRTSTFTQYRLIFIMKSVFHRNYDSLIIFFLSSRILSHSFSKFSKKIIYMYCSCNNIIRLVCHEESSFNYNFFENIL